MSQSTAPAPRLRLAPALVDSLRGGYGRRDLLADLLAGASVGCVALPLSMALAVASGVAPQHGLYTAIVAGALIALLGGSHVQVSGPTAAFVVVLAPIASKHGLSGLMIATVLAGLMLIVFGMARLGGLIQFIPYPVTTGFTAGIAIVIAFLQLRDFLGLTVMDWPDHFLDRLVALTLALPTLRLSEVAIGAFTLAVLLLWPRVSARIPSPLVGLTAGGLAAWALSFLGPDWSVETISSRFHYDIAGVAGHGIPRLPPLFAFPWSQAGAADMGSPGLSLALIRELAPAAGAIAMLGAIESLLSAVVSDGMTGRRHDPDAELVAQGVGNVVAPFFGGFAATGAIARTATNVRAGARSPLASFFHAGFLLASMIALAPLLGALPMASMAALMLVVAWNMSHVRHVARTMRLAPRSDRFVLATCVTLTVVFDMVVSVTVGVLLASMLFMRRMIAISGATRLESEHVAVPGGLPPGLAVYEIAGPLFFGAAHKAVATLGAIGADVRVVVLDLGQVPFLDETGVVNLESAVARMRREGRQVVLSGIRQQPRSLLEHRAFMRESDVIVQPSLQEAITAGRAKLPSSASGASAAKTSAP